LNFFFFSENPFQLFFDVFSQEAPPYHRPCVANLFFAPPLVLIRIFFGNSFVLFFEKDSATRSALNALPHSFHSGASQNGKKLHAPQLDGAADEEGNDLTLNKSSKGKTVRLSKPQKVQITLQLDGIGDDSDIDDDDEDDIGEVSIHGDEDDDDADDDKGGNDNSEYEGKEDPDPLNSDDDLTEPGTPDSNADLFDTDNVIVCQYDKVIFVFLKSMIDHGACIDRPKFLNFC